ncbi:hypothetical protein KY284_020083 [Solanum tuberosum]|nr:hypothetical protein KY284_020083 [Solanum tuberosum]
MPRHNNMSWIRNFGQQDGKHVALTMLQTLVEVFHSVGSGLHLSLPLSCILPMLSRSVSEYHANYETLGELNHVNNGIIAAFNMISVPRILWPMGHLEKLQVFSYHSHVQREVNYAATLNKAWNEALEFSHKGLAGACHQMHFIHLEVNVTTPRLPMLLLARFLDLNLEDKVLIEDGSIVMNQPQPNNNTNKYITRIDIRTSRPNTNNMARPSQRIIWNAH